MSWNGSDEIIDLITSVFGTSNEITVTDSGGNTITLSLANPLTTPGPATIGGALTVSDISVPDNTANAFRLLEGANVYIKLDTSDGVEQMTIGSGAIENGIDFLGDLVDFSAAGQVLVDLLTAQDGIVKNNSTGVLRISGSTSGDLATNTNIFIYGASHATKANQIEINDDAGVPIVTFKSKTAVFGGATLEASSLVTMNSTTQGLLTPRMTYAQMLAISSPANRLQVHVTNKWFDNIWTFNADVEINQWTANGWRIFNNEGATISDFGVVQFGGAVDFSVDVTGSVADVDRAGVAVIGGVNGANVAVKYLGECPVNKAAVSLSRQDFLFTEGTAGLVDGSPFPGSGDLGRALEDAESGAATIRILMNGAV